VEQEGDEQGAVDAAARRSIQEIMIRLGAVEERFDQAAVTVAGLGALQAVIAHDPFLLGRALAACACSRLLEKLHACPSARRASSGDPVIVEIDCTLAAVDQMVNLANLVSVSQTSVRGREGRTLHLRSFLEVSAALAMTPGQVAAAGVRRFTRRNQSVVTRVCIESFRDEAGHVFFVLGRHPETGEVSVAVRDSEELDFRGLSFVSSLVRKKVRADDLAGLPDAFPAHWTWKQSKHGEVSTTAPSARDATGRLKISVPVSLVPGTGEDVASLLG